jgi:hypothetical protein
MRIFPIRSMAVLLCLALAMPAAQAQNPPAAGPAAPIYTPKQLDQLLAPIALYPDQLLTQVLIAASYPQQIVDAATWLQDPNNAKLTGDALVAALQPLDWDPSVKSLIAFPQIIATLNQHMDWTEALGIAFANQQADTMAQIQVLRQQAASAGTLKTTTQLAVTTEGSDIIIEPGEASIVYVPVYNPATVYGEWRYADYPPVYLPPPPSYTGTVGVGIGFGVGFGVVRPLWGFNRPDWRSHEVNVDRNRYTGLSANHQPPPGRTWQHQGPFVPATLPATRPAAPAFEHPPGTVVPGAVNVPGRAPPPATTTTTPATTPPAHETPAHPPGTTPAATTPPANQAPAHPPGTTPAVTTPPAHEAPGHQPGTTPAVTAPPQHEAPAHPPGTTPAVTAPPQHQAPPPAAAPQHEAPPQHQAPPPAAAPQHEAPPQHQAPPPAAAPQHEAPPQHQAPPPAAAPPQHQAPPPAAAPPQHQGPPPSAAPPQHQAPPPGAAPAHPASPPGGGGPAPKKPPGQGEEPPK